MWCSQSFILSVESITIVCGNDLNIYQYRLPSLKVGLHRVRNMCRIMQFTDHLKGQTKIEVLTRKNVDKCPKRHLCHINWSFSEFDIPPGTTKCSEKSSPFLRNLPPFFGQELGSRKGFGGARRWRGLACGSLGQTCQQLGLQEGGEVGSGSDEKIPLLTSAGSGARNLSIEYKLTCF